VQNAIMGYAIHDSCGLDFVAAFFGECCGDGGAAAFTRIRW